MKYVIEAFSILFTLMVGLYGSVSVVSVSGQIAAAKEYKADVIAEIENSNFNPSVIAACTSQADEVGYQLMVSDCTYVRWEISIPQRLFSLMSTICHFLESLARGVPAVLRGRAR